MLSLLSKISPILIVYAFLACWSVVIRLLTRSVRGMYLVLHVLNWLFWLGMAALAPGQIVLFLTIPLSISLVLLGLYKPIIQYLPFLRQDTHSASPKNEPVSSYPLEMLQHQE